MSLPRLVDTRVCGAVNNSIPNDDLVFLPSSSVFFGAADASKLSLGDAFPGPKIYLAKLIDVRFSSPSAVAGPV